VKTRPPLAENEYICGIMKKFLFCAIAATAIMSCTSKNAESGYIGPSEIKIENGVMTPETLLALGRLSDPQLSPDGSRILYGVSYTSVKDNRSCRNIFICNTDGTGKVCDHTLAELKQLNFGYNFQDENGNTVKRYGFSFTLGKRTFGLWAKTTWNTSMDTVRLVRLSLKMLLTGQAGLKDMTGPVGIVQQMSSVAEASGSAWYAFLNLLYFGGFIAINLAVMNLLPIPALDGGRVVGLLLTTAVEAITRKKVDPRVEGYIHGVGMILLLALMAVIMFKDIFFIVKG